jgi:DNA-binding beta-propeller fold protein YncE
MCKRLFNIVYVASKGNDSVVVISPDGKRCRTVLGKSDGMHYPTAICFDKVKNNLVVCNYFGTAFLQLPNCLKEQKQTQFLLCFDVSS